MDAFGFGLNIKGAYWISLVSIPGINQY